MKINVVGTSGSGKSTVARALAKELNYPYIEMDALFWGKNWTMTTDEIFFDKLTKALDQKDWVLDGNYHRTIEIKWKEVDMVVWLDYSFFRTLYQAISRAFKRIITRKELWAGTGNREQIWMLFSKDSIILWTLKSYSKIKTRYTNLMKDPDYSHIQFVRLRNPKAYKAFLKNISEHT